MTDPTRDGAATGPDRTGSTPRKPRRELPPPPPPMNIPAWTALKFGVVLILLAFAVWFMFQGLEVFAWHINDHRERGY